MTNQEAIKWIKYHIGISDYDETDDLLKAFETAIKALETMERIKARRRELETKMHSSFSLTEATEHYALVKLLMETESGE